MQVLMHATFTKFVDFLQFFIQNAAILTLKFVVEKTFSFNYISSQEHLHPNKIVKNTVP